jgi:RimJ/RimL family protein N-acetyltransferase
VTRDADSSVRRDRADLSPLYALRLRTPRLELRLGTAAEVRALGELAEQGIHPSDEMPFAVAWSDRIGSPGFLPEFEEYHRSQLEAWTPEDWTLNLLVWEGPRLVGTQGIMGRGFAHHREVSTGSWVGAAHQGRGIGTEMRAAVLELGFRGLGAVAATSGWLEGNRSSARVSEKLGYRETGISTVSPRGIPVPHHDVRLERADWRCPIAVGIEGLEPALPLFGL